MGACNANENTMAFPKNMTLGAIDDLELIEELGFEIGRQAKRVSIHMNLAPVADVNSNPKNPIIGMRSFGVARHWRQWAKCSASCSSSGS